MDERELVIAAKKGDRDAFSQLLNVELQRAYPIALVILENRADAEDAVHEAVISAMNALNTLRYDGMFRGWFRKIVVNHARDILRRRSGGLALDSSQHTLPAVLHDHELSIDIRDAIGSLPDAHQKAILLYYSGLSTREVAEILGRPLGTVQRILSEAYRMLRQSLGPDYDYRGRRHGP